MELETNNVTDVACFAGCRICFIYKRLSERLHPKSYAGFADTGKILHIVTGAVTLAQACLLACLADFMNVPSKVHDHTDQDASLDLDEDEDEDEE